MEDNLLKESSVIVGNSAVVITCKLRAGDVVKILSSKYDKKFINKMGIISHAKNYEDKYVVSTYYFVNFEDGSAVCGESILDYNSSELEFLFKIECINLTEEKSE